MSEDEASSSKMEETIPGTFDFINGHGGFLNEDFRLFSTNNQSGELTYQRFLTVIQRLIKKALIKFKSLGVKKASLIIVVRYYAPTLF